MKDKPMALAPMLKALGIEQTVNFKDCYLLLGELFAATRCSPKVGELSGNEWAALVNLVLARYKGHVCTCGLKAKGKA
jgi:hypothetical protein